MDKPAKSQRHAAAGSLGGKATYRKYGSTHMAAIGTQGAKVMHTLYDLVPFKQDDFALVHRETGKIVAYLSGYPVEES